MAHKPLILVTGVTGFLGSHIVYQLLQNGYRVRGTARSSKVQLARDGYPGYQDRYEVVPIDDLMTADFTNALEGAEAVIHQAAPLLGRAESPAA
ncbi:hypothetical protein AcV5_002956 [Taiwanofungus camphoratus]|nr:hypothetical protein AcV5_002956 [Antrodia cinnamomea]